MEYHIIVHGNVQGVGFRWFTTRVAESYGIRGWVRNKANGTVEILSQGEEDKLKLFIDKIKQGPSSSMVTSVDINKTESDKNYNNFQVVR